jgi:FkbM family methyltransferase
MPSFRRSLRLAARRAGVDLVRYPESEPLWRIAKLQRAHGVDLVLDVGANDGGYASSIRQHGYRNRIVSFEPVSHPFRRLRAKAAADPAWVAVQCAIGNSNDEVTINVAGNNAASSSVLPMLERHRSAAPSSAYIATERVAQQRLDDILPTLSTAPGDRLFLKIDVQGYESAVLDGADRLLHSGQVVGLQLELSFTPLYDGGMSWREGMDRATDLGMALMSLDAGFADATGQMLQADAVFFVP